jgi:hypothetical protein
MFRIKNLTVRNFMSVGNATQAVEFDRRDLTLVLGENIDLGGDDSGARNGTGKTTIINALSYALYGTALTNIKKDNLINKTNAKGMLVTIDFEVNGESYRIERGRKHNVLKFYIGDVRDPNSVKNAMYGVDYVFHAAALKQVPSCEFFPIEAVKTNILGTENVLDAAIANGVDLKGVPFFKSQRACQLFDVASAHEVADSVREICEAENVRPSLIIVDTVARNMGGDENSTPDMARFVEHIDALLRIPYQANVLMVHHSGKASPGQARGSTVLRGALDQEYMVDMDDASHMVSLVNKKMKDGEVPAEKRFSIKQVGLGLHGKDGVEIVGACLETVDISLLVHAVKDAAASLTKNQNRGRRALESLIYARRRDGNMSPVTMDDWREACREAEVPRNRFHEIKDALVAKKVITVNHANEVTLVEDATEASEASGQADGR